MEPILDALHDRGGKLLLRARRREIARDVEERAARPVSVVVLNLLENSGDPSLHRDEQRGEHESGPECDDVLARLGHPLQSAVEQSVQENKGHAAQQHRGRGRERLADEDLDVPEPPLEDRIGERERNQDERHHGRARQER